MNLGRWWWLHVDQGVLWFKVSSYVWGRRVVELHVDPIEDLSGVKEAVYVSEGR